MVVIHGKKDLRIYKIMHKRQLTKIDIVSAVLKLKNQLYDEENENWHKKDTYDIAHKYLNKVLDILDRYHY